MKKYLLKEYKWCTLTLALTLGVKACGGAMALVLMQLFEQTTARDKEATFLMIGLLLVIMLLSEFFGLGADVAKSKTIEKLNNHLRDDISKKIMHMDFKEFRKNHTGDYISWYINDVTQAEKQGFEHVFYFCESLFSILVGTVLLLQFHWFLLVVALFFSGIIILTSKKMDAILEKHSEDVSHFMEVFSEKMKEQINGISVLRSLGCLPLFYQKMQAESAKLERNRYQFQVLKSKAGTLVGIVNSILMMLSYAVLIIMGFEGLIPISTIMGGSNLLSMVESGTASLGDLRLSIVSAKPYFDKLAYEENEKKDKKKSLTNPISKIVFDKVRFSYGEKNVLNNVNYTFEKGKKYVFIGASGSGKTTVLRLLLGYLDNYKGNIYFDNTEMREIEKDSISKQVAYIEQDIFLFNTTIRENITLGLQYEERDMARALRCSALDKEIANFENGLDTIVGENGNKLSGGQKQRIAIARALLHKRSILLVDEGTSALDQANARIVENSLLQDKELTLVFISHTIEEKQKEKFDTIYCF